MVQLPIWDSQVHPAHLPDVKPTWAWAYCRVPFCGHVRAVPFAPWRIRWGVEDAPAAMRHLFRCSVCGRRGCEFVAPRLDGDGIEAFPPAGAQVRINGERQPGETYPAAEARNRAEYLARYPTGDALGEFRGAGATLAAMCNLYSLSKGQQAIRDLVRAMRDLTGNLPPLPAIFPNRLAPVVRTGPDGVRELLMMRWGFPPPAIPGSKPRNPYLTNVRNTDSRYWRAYLKAPANRCLVPVTSFAEPDNNQGPRSIWTWFARDEGRPLMFFAGIWREWEGDRGTKAAPDIGRHLVFAFLTTDASPDVAPIHPDATPVLLLDEPAREQWMNAPWELARDLQRPPPAGTLRVVTAGPKEDS